MQYRSVPYGYGSQDYQWSPPLSFDSPRTEDRTCQHYNNQQRARFSTGSYGGERDARESGNQVGDNSLVGQRKQQKKQKKQHSRKSTRRRDTAEKADHSPTADTAAMDAVCVEAPMGEADEVRVNEQGNETNVVDSSRSRRRKKKKHAGSLGVKTQYVSAMDVDDDSDDDEIEITIPNSHVVDLGDDDTDVEPGVEVPLAGNAEVLENVETDAAVQFVDDTVTELQADVAVAQANLGLVGEAPLVAAVQSTTMAQDDNGNDNGNDDNKNVNESNEASSEFMGLNDEDAATTQMDNGDELHESPVVVDDMVDDPSQTLLCPEALPPSPVVVAEAGIIPNQQHQPLVDGKKKQGFVKKIFALSSTSQKQINGELAASNSPENPMVDDMVPGVAPTVDGAPPKQQQPSILDQLHIVQVESLGRHFI